MRRIVLLLILALPFFTMPRSLAATPAGDVTSERTLKELSRRAAEALEAGDLGTATELYAELCRTDPANPAGWYGAGLTAEASGDLLEAIEHFGRAAELDPERAGVHLAHGRSLLKAGAAPQALVAFERARRADPAEPNGYLFAALLFRDSGRLGEAEDILRAALEQAASRPEIFDQLGLVLLSRRASVEALATAEAGLSRFPDSARLRLVRGLALADNPERRKEAIAELERALAEKVGGAPACARLGELLLAEGRTEDGIARLKQAIELAPGSSQAHYQLGLALQRAGRAEEAEVALDRFRVLREERDQSQLRAKRLGQELNVALEHIQANRLEQALDSVERILAEAPGHGRSLAVRAKILFSLARIEEAYQTAQSAVASDPGTTEHHYLEGLFAYHAGELPEARAALRRALSMDPDLAEAHEVAAVVALRLERHAEAVGHFERAIALGVDSDELRRAYQLALEAAGQEP